MKTLLLISPDPLFTAAADHILSAHFRTVIPCEIASAIDIIYNDTPDLLVVDLAAGDKATVAFINNLKDDPLFSPLPILVVVGEQQPVAARWEDLFVEDWLRRSDLERDLLSRVQLAVVRSGRTVEVNPLTRLPGNISINRQIQKRMGLEHFSLAYADLSDFKPFNDKYGFSRGDEVIKITGRLILNIVKNLQPQGTFVGHIGGDDFVFIMETERIEEACQEILKAFNQIIPTFYDSEDRECGGISSVDRHGITRFFPFIAIDIGVTGTDYRRFSHFGELTSAASEMKNHAKKTKGGSFCIDRRRHKPSAYSPYEPGLRSHKKPSA